MRTIETDIQEKIIDLLPADGMLALRIVCQLIANMIISIDGATLPQTLNQINYYFADYEGT